MYIDDVTSKLVDYCFKSSGKLFNILPEIETNIFALAKAIVSILKSESKILNKENSYINDHNKINLPVDVMVSLRQYIKNLKV